jgi:hypothetical protein
VWGWSGMGEKKEGTVYPNTPISESRFGLKGMIQIPVTNDTKSITYCLKY